METSLLTELVKAELGNLVFQLALKEMAIRDLQKQLDAQKKTQPEPDRPA
jgi:hypothetical protein